MQVLLILLSVVVLIYLVSLTAQMIHKGFLLLAYKLKISNFIIGFAVLGMASSLPELGVALSAGIEGTPQLSAGTLLGCIVVLFTLMIALNTFKYKRMPIKGIINLNKLLAIVAFVAIIPLSMLLGEFTITTGVIILVVYLILLRYLGDYRSTSNKNTEVNAEKIWRIFVKSAIGLFGLLIFSNLLVDQAVSLASVLGVGPSVIGILVIALGTNVPELAVLLTSSSAEGTQLTQGNLLGSASANVAILGFLSIIHPFEIESNAVIMPAVFAAAAALVIFTVFARSDREVTRKEGAILLCLYFMFIFFEVGKIILT